ncbi:YdgA family protein [Pseudoclavibacter sp. 13-3]|uniref:YdgA family protein n=1 Tax=Pseudoclavibacter sp. 13-3 TaxID=2901228 RepID=UPI001E506D44|nr:YdgA family protein [Pseudoclavibacter sp. 13-3]MCD7101361.1 YdgA family protein [Pseudoclavibacter sp. 13-3]
MTRISTDRSAEPRRARWPWRAGVIATIVLLVVVFVGAQWYGQRETTVLTDANAAAVADETPVLSLRRGGGYQDDGALRGDDRIVRSDMADAGMQTVFTAPRIQTFVVDDRWIVVAVADRRTAATKLELLDRQAADATSKDARELVLPIEATVIGLALAGDTVSATINPLDYSQPGGQVIAWSLVGGEGSVSGAPVHTPDGELVQGNQVVLTEDGRFAVVRQWDNTMLRVALSAVRTDQQYDDAERAPLPLGSYTEVLGSAAQQRLLVSDQNGTFALVDPVNGGRQRLDTSLPKDVDGGSRLVQLAPAPFGAVAVYEKSAGDQTIDTVYSLTRDGARRIATSEGRGSVSGVCASPSGRFIAVTTAPADASDDGYVMMPNVTGAQTEVFAADQPVSIGTLPGLRPSWCQGYQRVLAGLY